MLGSASAPRPPQCDDFKTPRTMTLTFLLLYRLQFLPGPCHLNILSSAAVGLSVAGWLPQSAPQTTQPFSQLDSYVASGCWTRAVPGGRT